MTPDELAAINDTDALIAEHDGSHYCGHGPHNLAFGDCLPKRLAVELADRKEAARGAVGQAQHEAATWARKAEAAEAEVRTLTERLAEANGALSLAMHTLTNHLDAYAKLSGLPDEYTDDDEVVYETIAGKIAQAERALAEHAAAISRVRALAEGWEASPHQVVTADVLGRAVLATLAGIGQPEPKVER